MVAPRPEWSAEPYKFEVFQQCFAATQAWNRAQGRLSEIPTGPPEAPMLAALQIVADLQGFIVAVGILSDLLFPTKQGDPERGKRLCALYDVRPDSPLAGSKVKVRHLLVHIDENLDRWLVRHPGRPVGPVAIQPWEGEAPPMETATAARIVDNEQWRLLVLGEELDLMPLLKEVGRIGALYPLEWDGPDGKLRLAIDVPRSETESASVIRNSPPD